MPFGFGSNKREKEVEDIIKKYEETMERETGI
jgi:hypothetical protein